MKMIYFIVLFFLAHALMASQPSEEKISSVNKFSLSGKVMGFQSGEALTGVEIEVISSGKTVYTDFDGRFELTGLDADSKYTIQVSYVSFKKRIIRGINADQGELIIKLNNEKKPGNQKVSGKNPRT